MGATLQSEGYLRVADWQNSRHFQIEGNILKVEVARRSCQHCPVCTKRIRAVEFSLRATNANWRWENGPGNGLYLAVELPGEVVWVDIHLQTLLGLPVSIR
jgi:hypothetical protein